MNRQSRSPGCAVYTASRSALKEGHFLSGLLQEGAQAFKELVDQVSVNFPKAPLLTKNVKILNVMCIQIKHICGSDVS